MSLNHPYLILRPLYACCFLADQISSVRQPCGGRDKFFSAIWLLVFSVRSVLFTPSPFQHFHCGVLPGPGCRVASLSSLRWGLMHPKFQERTSPDGRHSRTSLLRLDVQRTQRIRRIRPLRPANAVPQEWCSDNRFPAPKKKFSATGASICRARAKNGAALGRKTGA